ncbi:hypothetical protein LCX93_06285 [Sulfurimonas sp. SWIR-19]|uniref:hypothetical protein n=1 Tax=Sulfurimonas sp. SWIR-19 TaxID=2878390 RepID=UPI001CF5F936|nr:hypothetical protein [Sulfurimonas sp. SWIR-19]UCN01522.1 hypothetical protein LCX93_06285 [Sulfurimonas sp. SWIR-19]
MIDIGMAVGSVKSAIEIAKTLKDSADLFDKAEVKLQLAELIGSLADAKMQIAEIQESLINSEKEKKDLRKKIEIKDNMIYEKSYYWKMDGDKKDGPFCQRCFDSDEKLIRLQGGNNDVWACAQCNKTFRGPAYVYKSRTTNFRRT